MFNAAASIQCVCCSFLADIGPHSAHRKFTRILCLRNVYAGGVGGPHKVIGVKYRRANLGQQCSIYIYIASVLYIICIIIIYMYVR